MRDWHDIKFYTVPEMMTMLLATGPVKSMADEILSELCLCSPLVFRESLARNQRYLIGKVMEQGSPWDVVIHEETQLRAIHGTNKPMPDPLFIQLKELFIYDTSKTIELAKWLEHVKSIVKKAADKYGGREPIGILQLYNRMPLEKTSLKNLEEELIQIKLDEPIPFKQVSLTIDAEETGILNWQLYPFFHAIGSIRQEDIPRLKEIYGLS